MGYRWDEFEFDVPGHRLTGADGDIHVEPQVFDVLRHLVEHRDRVVTKEELLDEVWGDHFVSESALTTRIKSARKALGDDGRTQRYIRNVHGRGYQFVGELLDGSDGVGADGAGSGVPDGDPSVRSVTPRPLHFGASIAVDDEFAFVGRENELDQIDIAIRDPGSTQVFIGGAAGIGKSRLAIEALARASPGTRVCAGRCEESLTGALHPIRDAVGQLAAAHPDAFRSWSVGLEGQLLHLLPSAAAIIEGRPVAVDGYASIDVLLALVDRASESAPLILLVDDVQWSDEPTRALLSQLHRRFGDRPIATLATYRSGNPDLRGSAREWVSSQRRLPNALRLDLDELDNAAALQLTEHVLGPDAGDVEELLARTGGHALFLTETIRDRTLGAEATGSVAELVAGRFERLDPAVRDLVRVGAVSGPTFSFEIAGAAADLEPADALAAVEQAIEAELLHETDSPSEFRFSHQLVPEAIRASLGRATLARTHLRLAEELEERNRSDATIAWHLLGAIPLVQTEEALERAVRAAERDIDDNEFDRAIRLLERCLDVDTQTRQRAELLVMVGDARVLSGRSIAAVQEFDEAAALARGNGWTDILVASALGRFGASPFRNVSERETVAMLREALDALPEGPSVERARLTGKLAVFLAFDERLAVREEMSKSAMEMAAEVGADEVERMKVLESHCIVLSCPAAVERLEPADKELRELLDRTNRYFADAAAPETPHLMRGEGVLFRTDAERDEIRARKQPIAEWRDLALRATIAAFEGDAATARVACDDAASIGGSYWGESAAALQAFTHLFIDQVTGDWSRSPELFAFILQITQSVRILPPAGLALAKSGSLDEASRIAELLVERKSDFDWFDEYILGGNMLSAAAELGLALDHDDLCRVAEENLLPHAHLVLGLPWGPSLAAADSLSRLAKRRGDGDSAAMHAQTARDLYTSLGAPALLERFDRVQSN